MIIEIAPNIKNGLTVKASKGATAVTVDVKTHDEAAERMPAMFRALAELQKPTSELVPNGRTIRLECKGENCWSATVLSPADNVSTIYATGSTSWQAVSVLAEKLCTAMRGGAK